MSGKRKQASEMLKHTLWVLYTRGRTSAFTCKDVVQPLVYCCLYSESSSFKTWAEDLAVVHVCEVILPGCSCIPWEHLIWLPTAIFHIARIKSVWHLSSSKTGIAGGRQNLQIKSLLGRTSLIPDYFIWDSIPTAGAWESFPWWELEFAAAAVLLENCSVCCYLKGSFSIWTSHLPETYAGYAAL